VDGSCQHRPSGFVQDEECDYQLSNCRVMKEVRTLEFMKFTSAILLLQSYFTGNVKSLMRKYPDLQAVLEFMQQQTKSELQFVSYALGMNTLYKKTNFKSGIECR
jgi:hypothetical protein